jgi:hypothetical protein
MRDLHPSAAHGEVGGGEAVIHLHAIVDAIALLGRDFTPTQVERKRARKTKADRFFWFDEVPDAAEVLDPPGGIERFDTHDRFPVRRAPRQPRLA